MWHFHQKKIIQRYITMRPKLEASKNLKKIVSRLTLTTEKNLTQKLDDWYENHKDFLDEKVFHPLPQNSIILIQESELRIEA